MMNYSSMMDPVALSGGIISNFTNVFIRNCLSKKRYKINKGGTRSSKTISDIQKLIIKSHSKNINDKIFSVVSESMPHMKRSALRDFRKMMRIYGLWDDDRFNKTDHIYTIGSNIIEFFSADNEGKVHSASRDYLLLIEAQNIPYEIAYQMFMRTNIEITIEYNPTHKFWVDYKYLENPDYEDEIELIHSTYKDNPFLDPRIIRDILIRAKTDPNFKRVYIDGEVGTLEGLIYKQLQKDSKELTGWRICKNLPEVYEREFYGLDFGFTNDPSCLTQIRVSEGQLYIKELFYEKGLYAKDIDRKLTELGITKQDEIISDNNAPVISTDLADNYGWNIEVAIKGPDSVKFGISLCKSYIVNITQDSVNGIREMRGYSWKKNKLEEDEYIEDPIKKDDHFCDSFRYPIQTLLAQRKIIPDEVY